MTPADLAMKSALYEGVRFANSPPVMPSVITPLLEGYPEPNLTTFELHGPKSSETLGLSLSRPVTPHLTLHDFRKLQQSPAPSSSPDHNHQRLRRKDSFSRLGRVPSASIHLPWQDPSSPPLIHSASSYNFLPSLLSPLPLTPVPRTSTTSPSLSSTVDTLQSTPTHTPIQHGSSISEQRRGFETIELAEPIRTKRKFPALKQAKRLPHCNSQDGGSGSVWQVHAAVFDIGGGDTGNFEDLGREAGEYTAGVKPERGLRDEAKALVGVESSGRKGRSVRFEGLDSENSGEGEQSRKSETARSDQEREGTLTSSYSLSKFKFPAPPDHPWTGTFGHLAEPTPPTSPATLHYKGASFDVVNPHASFILGTNDIETPAEIDGLLDEYFASRHTSAAMSSDDLPGQLQYADNVSHQGRVLYDNPESARRTIMRIPEAETATQARGIEDGGGVNDVLENSNNEEPSRPDRNSSVYPQSQRSDPFDLSVSDCGDSNHNRHNTIDQVITAGRSSFYARNGALDDQEDGFAVYDDVNDANAAQNNLEPESTVGNIVDHYNYPRSPLAPLNTSHGSSDSQATLPDWSRPPSLELARVHNRGDDDVFQFTREPENGRRRFIFEFPRHASRVTRLPDPRAHAPPALEAGAQTPEAYYSGFTDLPTTDRTYGNTGQLLQLTPQEARNQEHPVPASSSGSGFGYYGLIADHVVPNYGFQRTPSEAAWFGDGEDKENTPPHDAPGAAFTTEQRTWAPLPWHSSDLPSRRPAYRYDTAANDVLRSSSYYPDDHGSWETQASEGRAHAAGESARPSEESYADTSAYGSLHRLSGSRNTAADISGPRASAEATYIQASRRPQNPTPFTLPTTNWTAVPENDEQRALEILKAKMEEQGVVGQAATTTPSHDEVHRRPDMFELERLRQKNPGAVQRAVNAVTQKMQRLSPLKPMHSPRDSFSQVAALGSNQAAHQSTSSETQQLLGNFGSPFMSNALRHSDSANTFQTTPRPISSAHGPSIRSVRGWSPFTPSPLSPPGIAMVRDGPNRTPTRATITVPTIGETPITENIEMTTMRRPQPTRAAMSSQTELQPLRLASSTASGPTGRLTDAQLAAAEPHWTVHGARIPIRTHSVHIAQADGTMERVSLLMPPSEARMLGVRAQQRRLSRVYFRLCILCPVTAVIFGLGGFDSVLERKTGGSIREMLPEMKKGALWVYAPMGIIFYSIVGLMVAMIATAGR